MRIRSAASTGRFVGSADAPRQVVRVVLDGPGPASLRVVGRSLTTPSPVEVTAEDTGERTIEVPVVVGSGAAHGDRIDAAVVADDGEEEPLPFPFEVGEPGWRMFMVSHFHYDPVWWNTQAFYTETWEKLPRELRPWEGRRQQPAFTLIDAHLDVARRDPDYRFVLAELDYLKPYWDTYPWRRDEIRQLMADGRLELMGGTYNEPNTNLTSAESTARNAVYGIGYQRHVLGGDPASAWQLDVFGHDPQFPGMMADAGLTSSSWARGPFHQWGPSRSPGGNSSMQFSSEFDWVSPSGRGLLTSYMANHYSAGWELDAAVDLEHALEEAYRLFTELQAVAATRNVLLPVGSDYTPPNRWMTDIQRVWNDRYVWPRFEGALPRDFFAAVRSELADGPGPSPQTRDMNPVYSGKDVSYIDTKQAQRVGENLLLAAEKFGTVASLLGARYPAEAVDKAWRQLLYGAHHDGITGTESDQVYLDLLGGWRDTYELATGALDDALEHIGSRIDTRGDGRAVTVFNPLSWVRTDPVELRVELGRPVAGVALLDEDGEPVPFVAADRDLGGDGLVTALTLEFVAVDVPSLGYRTYRLVDADAMPADAAWEDAPGTRITNSTHEVEVDPARGGTITSIVDRRDGTQVLRADGLGNEVLAYQEYPTHPEHGEGPWHLIPTGEVVGSSQTPAQVVRSRSAIGERLTVQAQVGGCDLTQTITLHHGVARVDCVSDLDGFDGQDTLFRLRLAADVPGGLPICEVGNAVVGRGAGFPDIDVADAPYTLDNPAYDWFGIGTTARVRLSDMEGGQGRSRAMAVAEIVEPDTGRLPDELRELVVALVRSGVTSTASRGRGPRYGSMDTDSNLPDVRIAMGGPDHNAFAAEVLDVAAPAYREELDRQLDDDGIAAVWVPAERALAEVWRPNADLRGCRTLPVLVLAGRTPEATARSVRRACAGLGDAATIDVVQPRALHTTEDRAAERTVAVLNRGLPGCNVDVHGDLHLSLMRSCSGWPSGVWLDPPRRTVPDGSSFQFQHWTHRFEYAFVAGAGDWRDVGVVRAGHQFNTPLLARQLPSHGGRLPSYGSFLTVGSDDVVVTAMKPAGNPMARMASPASDEPGVIAVRCYEANGRDVDTHLSLFRPLRRAATADLLETELTSVDVEPPGAVLRLRPAAIQTLRLAVDADPATGPELGRRREPAQPVFGDYWLHNKGAAPLGYQPVTVRIAERAVHADGPFTLGVAIASQRTDDEVAGMVELVVPPGWTVEPARRSFHLAPGAHDVLRPTVVPAADAALGRWFVAARIVDDAGQVHEDVVTVDLGPPDTGGPADGGEPGHRVLFLERATRKAAVMECPIDPATVAPFGGELSASLVDDAVRVAHGGTREIGVRLDNHVQDTIRGEVQLISPWGTWGHLRPWTTGFEVAAGGHAIVPFRACCPPGTPPTFSWALWKVMYFGRVLYTASIPVELGVAAPPAVVS